MRALGQRPHCHKFLPVLVTTNCKEATGSRDIDISKSTSQSSTRQAWVAAMNTMYGIAHNSRLRTLSARMVRMFRRQIQPQATAICMAVTGMTSASGLSWQPPSCQSRYLGTPEKKGGTGIVHACKVNQAHTNMTRLAQAVHVTTRLLRAPRSWHQAYGRCLAHYNGVIDDAPRSRQRRGDCASRTHWPQHSLA